MTDRSGVRYIYSTFPILEREETAAYERYRSCDLCLAYMNALAAGDTDADIDLYLAVATWTRSDIAGLSRHDERWPLVVALVWIATRSRRYVEAFSAREPRDIEALLHPERTHGGLPPGLTLAEAFYEIDRKIAMGRLRGRARKLKWTIPPEEEMATPERYSALTRPPEVIEDVEFLPQELRNAMIAGEPPLRWSDFVFHDGDSLTPKGSGYGSPNADGSRARWSWQAVSFDREDLLRLWPDLPCVTAWRNAKAIPWRPTAPKSGADAEIVRGRRFIPLPDVVALVAFGPNLQPLGHDATEAMAMRFRACKLVVDAAARGRLGFIGRAAFRMRNFPGGLGPATALFELDSAALVDLGPVLDGPLDWIGPTRFADEYAERGLETNSVTFVDVMVHAESFNRWWREVSGAPTPKKRGPKPKFDWPIIESEAMRLMDFHGDFSADDLEWNAQARLEAKLLDYCAAKFDREPSRSQLRSHIEGWLTRWRKQFDPGR